MSTNAVGIVLAGGGSRRFGSPKALAEVGGEPIIRRILRVFREEVRDTAIVTNERRLYGSYGAEIISDIHPGRGPLAGIHAGLVWARRAGAEGICCAPCDAPFLHGDLVRKLLSCSAGQQAVVPESSGPLGFEPLFGWYSVDALDQVESFLAANRLAIHQFVASLTAVRFLPLEEVAAIMDPPRLFFNVNGPDDLQTANRFAEESSDSTS